MQVRTLFDVLDTIEIDVRALMHGDRYKEVFRYANCLYIYDPG